MIRALAASALFAAIAIAAPTLAQERLPVAGSVAVLRGLDKVTGQKTDFDARLNRPVKFGTLEVLVRACRQNGPDDPPETAIYLEVTDNPLPRPGEEAPPEPVRIHSGWIFASSPAVNALEHPTYDVWAIRCKA